jgi:hypothetical protein
VLNAYIGRGTTPHITDRWPSLSHPDHMRRPLCKAFFPRAEICNSHLLLTSAHSNVLAKRHSNLNLRDAFEESLVTIESQWTLPRFSKPLCIFIANYIALGKDVPRKTLRLTRCRTTVNTRSILSCQSSTCPTTSFIGSVCMR